MIIESVAYRVDICSVISWESSFTNTKREREDSKERERGKYCVSFAHVSLSVLRFFRCIVEWLSEQKKQKKKRSCPFCLAKASQVM